MGYRSKKGLRMLFPPQSPPDFPAPIYPAYNGLFDPYQAYYEYEIFKLMLKKAGKEKVLSAIARGMTRAGIQARLRKEGRSEDYIAGYLDGRR